MGKVSGVYIIRHAASGKVYVGSSVDTGKRFGEHGRLLRLGNHVNPHLQAAWNLYGPEAFEFVVVDLVESRALMAAEQRVMDELRAADRRFGYNVNPASASRLGAKMTAEQCARNGAAKVGNSYRKGAVVPDETRARIAATLTGRKASPETRAKLSAIRRGKPKSPEHAAKIGAAHRGKTISEEQKAYLSSLYRGRTKAVVDGRLQWVRSEEGGLHQ